MECFSLSVRSSISLYMRMASTLLSGFTQTWSLSLHQGYTPTFYVILLSLYPTAIMFTAYLEKLA